MIRTDRRIVEACLRLEQCNVPPGGGSDPSDPRCLDPMFAFENQDICGTLGTQPRLIIKPEAVSRCLHESVLFQTFLVSSGAEQQIMTGLTYVTSNNEVAVVGVTTGEAAVTGEGIATITVSWQNLTASAQVTGLGVNCCDDQNVGMVAAIDNSLSSSQAFSSLFSTRLGAAKGWADWLAVDLNIIKDKLAIISFNEAALLEQAFTNDVAIAQAAIAGIASTTNRTNILDALQLAIDTAVADTTLERKVVIIFSDGENNEGESPIPLANSFKSSGGIIMVVGLRASGAGFTLLNHMASGGFFINATEDNEDSVDDWVRGLKGYFCAGNCTPPGNIVEYSPALNFDNFTNWTVVGVVDLLGRSGTQKLFDFLPGNGMYVDLQGTAGRGQLVSRSDFTLTAGQQYELTVELAGNQRINSDASPGGWGPFTTRIQLGTEIDQSVDIDWRQDFITYTYLVTPSVGSVGKILIGQTAPPAGSPGGISSFGNLLGYVRLRNITAGTTLLEDNFDAENSTFIGPACGSAEIPAGFPGAGSYAYNYDGCYGFGCLADPIPAQAPDEPALPNIE